MTARRPHVRTWVATALAVATLAGVGACSPGEGLRPVASSPGTVAAADARSTAAADPSPLGPGRRSAQGPAVTASPPQRLHVPAIGLDAPVTRYTDRQVADAGGVVRPASLSEVAWWAGGGMPGSLTRNTVYLFGHTWKEPAVFNRLKELRSGDVVEVTTAKGDLQYVVESRRVIGKPDLTSDPQVRAAVPGRLLLIGCYRRTGTEDHTTQNIVVQAQLASPGAATVAAHA